MANSNDYFDKEEKKKHLLEVAEKIFFKNNYDNTTMTEIAKKAGVAKGTLYLYFPSKKDLYYSLVTKGLGIIENIILNNIQSSKNGLEKVVSMAKSYVEFFIKHPDYYTLIANYEADTVDVDSDDPIIINTYSKSEKLFKYLILWVKEGIDDRSISTYFDPTKLSLVLWSEFTGMIQQVKLRKTLFKKWTSINPEDILNYFIEMTEKFLKSKE